MFRVNVWVCSFLSGSEFCRCIVSTIRRRRKRKRKNDERKEEEEDGESSSDDHIFVDNDTVYDSLLRLDISHNRHVLGKRGRKRAREREKNRDDTQKNGSE